MPAWLIPALKAALPHVASIVAAASPAFTRKNTADQSVLQQASDEQLARMYLELQRGGKRGSQMY